MPEMETQDFLNIVKDTRPRLLTLCQSFFDRQEMAYDVEDAVQETYLRLWQMRARIGEYQTQDLQVENAVELFCLMKTHPSVMYQHIV